MATAGKGWPATFGAARNGVSTQQGVLAKADAYEVAQALAIIAATADLLRRVLIEKPVDQGELGDPVVVGEEAVVTDTMEAVGQAMRPEAANKLMSVERRRPASGMWQWNLYRGFSRKQDSLGVA